MQYLYKIYGNDGRAPLLGVCITDLVTAVMVVIGVFTIGFGELPKDPQDEEVEDNVQPLIVE